MRGLNLFLALLILLTVAHAQDPVVVNPGIAKVEFENEHIRVLRVHYRPHQKFALHSHPAKVAVCLTLFHTRRLAPDGTSSEGRCPAGTVVWREPETHAVENLENAPAETLEIEFKSARQPSVSVIPAASVSAAAEPVPVHLEPRHHNVFENQYVRVMDVQIPPGDTTLYHTHSHDTVFIRLSDSLVQTQTKGEDWGPVGPVKSGEFQFAADAQHPLTHRARNAGATPFRVLDIEFLP